MRNNRFWFMIDLSLVWAYSSTTRANGNFCPNSNGLEVIRPFLFAWLICVIHTDTQIFVCKLYADQHLSRVRFVEGKGRINFLVTGYRSYHFLIYFPCLPPRRSIVFPCFPPTGLNHAAWYVWNNVYLVSKSYMCCTKAVQSVYS